MKKLLSVVLLLSAFFMSGCDKIDGPYGTSVTTPVTTDSVKRKVLLEDFTGHTCVACPLSHAEALRLQGVFGDQLVVLSIHSGYFAKPQVTPNGSYTYDFRTQTGDDISVGFNLISSTGTTLVAYPKGIINRTANNSGNTILDWSDWEEAISEQIAKPAEASLKINNSYDAGSNTVTSTVNTKAIAAISDPVSLCVYFAEDSIVNWQKDGTNDIQFYIHRHVLRGSLNGSWGESLGNLTTGDEATKTYSATLHPSDVKPAQVYIYAILYNEATKAVIQVEEKKMIP